MEIQGTLLKKLEVQRFSETFELQEFYLDASTFDRFTGAKKDNILKFQVSNSKIDTELGKVEKGDRIKVTFSINGRFWEKEIDGETKKGHIQSLSAFKIESLEEKPTAKSHQPTTNSQPPTAENPSDEEEDDLPF